MSLKIRLSRGGTKKRPYYRIVIADSRSPRDGRYIEQVGTHNPMLPKDHQDRVRIVEERLTYWQSQGAKATDRVARLLAAQGLGEKPKVPDQTKKNQPKAKAQERLREQEEKRLAAEEAAREAKEAEEAAAKEAAEAPKEEAPQEDGPTETPSDEAETPAVEESTAEKPVAEKPVE